MLILVNEDHVVKWECPQVLTPLKLQHSQPTAFQSSEYPFPLPMPLEQPELCNVTNAVER